MAVELSAEQKKEIARLQWRTAEVLPQVRLTKQANLHLTLKFIGDTTDNKIETIIGAMEQSAAAVIPFSLKFHGSGVFPSSEKARIIWIGVSSGADQLSSISSKLDTEMQNIGIMPENRKYKPHLTIGRLRKPEPVEKVCRLMEKEHNFTTVESTIDSMVLVKSDLMPGGPEYTSLKRVQFN